LFSVTLYDVTSDPDPEPQTISLSYDLRDFEGDEIYSDDDRVTFTDESSVLKTVTLPKDLEKGTYLFAVVGESEGYVSTSRYLVRVTEKGLINSFLELCEENDYFGILSIFILVVLVFFIIAMIYFIFKPYVKRNLKRNKFNDQQKQKKVLKQEIRQLEEQIKKERQQVVVKPLKKKLFARKKKRLPPAPVFASKMKKKEKVPPLPLKVPFMKKEKKVSPLKLPPPLEPEKKSVDPWKQTLLVLKKCQRAVAKGSLDYAEIYYEELKPLFLKLTPDQKEVVYGQLKELQQRMAMIKFKQLSKELRRKH